VLLEIPHCAALRGGEREIYAMRSADGQHWSEHWQLDDTSEQAARERRLSRTIYGEHCQPRFFFHYKLYPLLLLLPWMSLCRTSATVLSSELSEILTG